MPKIAVHGRNAIRRKMKEDYRLVEHLGGFKAVGEIWGISDGTSWRMIKKKNFWPKSKQVNDAIKKHGLSIGIVVGVRPLPKQ